MEKIKIGVSACLLGQEVRFDGGHKHDKFLTKTMADYFEYMPFCPEVAIGLGVPRETMRLVKNKKNDIRAVMPKSEADHTEALARYADEVAPRIQSISGYILKSKSPSCGMERVKIYGEDGNVHPANGVGIYAHKLMALCPLLPFEEEGRLCDPYLKENFIKRVFIYKEWQDIAKDLTLDAFRDFHVRHKIMLILHHYGNSKKLGRLVADVNDKNLHEIAAEYILLFTDTLKRVPRRRHHAQVLTRIVTNINKQISDVQKHDILDMIAEYAKGELPLSAPIRLIKHYLKTVDEPYIKRQSYLFLYPEKLGLLKLL